MSMNSKFFISIAFMFLSSVTYAEELGYCKDLKRVKAPYPHYPTPHQAKPYFIGTTYAHNFVEGFIEVEYVVEPDGTVKSIIVLDSEEKVIPQRNRAQSFNGFFETSVFPTLKRWKFEKIDKACKVKAKYTYAFDKSS